jgi:protein-tyrosine kinase
MERNRAQHAVGARHLTLRLGERAVSFLGENEDRMARVDKAFEEESVAGADTGQVSEPEFKVVPVSSRNIVYSRTRNVEIPQETFRANRIVSGYNPCFLTDAYKILSTQVSQKLRGNNWSTLGITSPGRREGKTLTAINLAISLAADFNQTALLVDADLRRPSVMEYFGLPQGPGLSEYLMWDTPIEELLIHPGVSGFVFLPGGKPLLNSSDALGWRRMADLVKELKYRYPSRVIVFDLPPLLHTADVLAFAPYLDAALLVVEEDKTLRSDVKRAEKLLGTTHLIGTVLNKSTEVRMPAERPDGGRGSLFRRTRR